MALEDKSPVFAALTESPRLYDRQAVVGRPSAVPAERGLYCWYFRKLPVGVPLDGCRVVDGWYLAYAGISPKNETSSQNLRKRLQYHYRGNAEGSTLRLTLGCLLSAELGLELRRVGSGRRLTFHEGESVLSQWMADNTRVAWAVHSQPWVVEPGLIRSVSLPLNLDHNARHSYASELSACRAAARDRARVMPIVG